MNPFFIITDYNHLSQDLSTSWIPKYAGNNYLLYDRADRWSENENIKKQKNVGENIYDMFDFIVNNYENLPEIMVFVKADVIPRHCGEDKFKKIIQNRYFTPIENYSRTCPPFSTGIYAYVDENDGYNEKIQEVNYTVSSVHLSRYIHSYQSLLNHIFENAQVPEYIRFAPGANYLLTKKDVLKYNKLFYENLRLIVSWDVRPGEAFLIERALYTLFFNDFTIREKYKSFF